MRIEDGGGLTLDERIEDLRTRHWRPMRRALLEAGTTAEGYRSYRRQWVRLLAQYVACHCSPVRIIGVTVSFEQSKR